MCDISNYMRVGHAFSCFACSAHTPKNPFSVDLLYNTINSAVTVEIYVQLSNFSWAEQFGNILLLIINLFLTSAA